MFSYDYWLTRSSVPDKTGRSEHIHAQVEVGTTPAPVGAHPRPASSEYLPAVCVRQRQAVPGATSRSLRGQR